MTDYLVASLIAFFGFFVRGVGGFGSALVITPLLLFIFNIKIVVPVIAILEVISTLYFTIEILKEVDWRYIKSFLLVSLAGIGSGSFILVKYSTDILKSILGIVIIIFSVRILILNILSEIIKRKKWPYFITYIVGIVAGILAGIYGIGGPPAVIFLENQIDSKDRLRATLILYFYFLDIVRIVPYIFTGLIGGYVIKVSLIMLPASIAGMVSGRLIYERIPEKQFRIFVGIVLMGSGILLFFF